MSVYYSMEEAREGAGLSHKTRSLHTAYSKASSTVWATEDTHAHREVMPYQVSAALVQTAIVSRKYHSQTVLLLFFNI